MTILCIMFTQIGTCKVLLYRDSLASFTERDTRVNIAEKIKEITERWGILQYVSGNSCCAYLGC